MKTNKIKNIEEDINDSTAATIHSQNEDINDHLTILDTVVNRFKTQLILVNRKETESKIVCGNIRIFIEKSDLDNNIANILNKFIIEGKIGIYSFLPDSVYNRLQTRLLQLYSQYNNITFVRCSHYAKDLQSEEEAISQISLFHIKESGHVGIIPNYEDIKRQNFLSEFEILGTKSN